MNKLNLLLLIALVVLVIGCRKVELPDPVAEQPVFGFWSGQIGETPMVMNNDSMFMSTRIVKDPVLNVNTFETTFNTIDSNKPRWILKYRDSKSMRTAADTSDLFYISESRYLKNSQLNQTGKVVTHSLTDLTMGNGVRWESSPGVSGEVIGGRHLSVENTELSGVNIIKATFDGNVIEKTYRPSLGDINIQAVKISDNHITFEIDQQSPNIKFKWGQGTPGTNNTFRVETSGIYKLEISDLIKERFLKIELHLEVSNGVIKQPKLPLFTSNTSKEYETLPNFSKMEIIYFDEDGKEYSTRYSDQPKPFKINEIETFHKTNSQGQKVKKLNIDFSVALKTADGNLSLEFTNVKADIGFAYE